MVDLSSRNYDAACFWLYQFTNSYLLFASMGLVKKLIIAQYFQLSWLLEAHCADGWLPSREHQRGLKLVKKILEESTKHKYDGKYIILILLFKT